MLTSWGLNICNIWSVIYILLVSIHRHNQNINTILNGVFSAGSPGFGHIFLSFSFYYLEWKLRLAAHFLWSKFCRRNQCLCYLHLGFCTFLFVSPLWNMPERSSSQESHYQLPEQSCTAWALHARDSALACCLLINFKAQSTGVNSFLCDFSTPVPSRCLGTRWRVMPVWEPSSIHESEHGWYRKCFFQFELENSSWNHLNPSLQFCVWTK